ISMFAIYSQLITAFYFRNIQISFLAEIFKFISIIAVISLPYIFITQDINLDNALLRSYTWTETFYYAALFWAVIPYVLISFLSGNKILLSLFYWSGALALNLLFLKRFILVDSVLLLIVILLINTYSEQKKFSNIRLIFSLSIVILIVSLFN